MSSPATTSSAREADAQRSGTASSRRVAVRAWLLVLVLLALAFPVVSTVLGLYDRIVHWGKLVHGIEGLFVALLVGVLLLGWRDRETIDLSDQLAGLLTIFSGIVFGVLWEIVEFVLDWVRYSDVQKSNSDTMTDFLWNDVGVVTAAVLAGWVYFHRLRSHDRAETGAIAAWLVDGPNTLLERHGLLIGILSAVVMAAAVAALWFAGRPIPGVGNG